MLEYNEVTVHRVILLDGEPYEVLDSHVFRKQQRKPVNQTKLRHLVTGKIMERAFHHTDRIEEADLSNAPIQYLYTAKGEYWFCEEADKSKRFTLSEEIVGPAGRFLKANDTIEALIFDERIIGVKIPIKVDLKVTEAPPAVRGNTAQGGSKQIILETGATIYGPLFINEGDVIRINTETGDYVERIEKK